ncbi:hypothetical protein [Propionivibrio sp.]|uniref:hypothetical protein n=1 Tax=Propionivibrio sp. TaxID=2212460 RepID=UPI003BF0C1BA
MNYFSFFVQVKQSINLEAGKYSASLQHPLHCRACQLYHGLLDRIQRALGRAVAPIQATAPALISAF